MVQPPRALQHLLQSMADAPCQAADPTAWGFSLGHVTLQQLQQHYDHRHTDSHEAPPAATAAADSFINKLETDHALASNHCVAAMAEQLGLSQYTDCLAGSLQAAAGALPDAAGADAALKAVRQQIDDAWSKEAVWRGVGFAKEGDYQQAMECYDKALTLNPGNCDAFVARGAARANQRQFEAALQDFKAALRIDPSNANAAKYLQATKQHMQVAGARPAAHPQQQQQQHSQEAGLHGCGDRARGANIHRRQQQQQQQHELLQERDERHRAASRSRSRSRSRRRGRSRSISRGRGRSRSVDKGKGIGRSSSIDKGRGRGRSRSMGRSRSRGRGSSIDRGRGRGSSIDRGRGRTTNSRSPSRSRSRSEAKSGSTSSSRSSSSSSSDDGGPSKVSKGVNVADIKEAIQVLRSESKHKRRKQQQKHSKKSRNKKQKRSSKHAKHHRSKHKHKSRH